jgi:nucleoside-diphosphate-sugar epimerase
MRVFLAGASGALGKFLVPRLRQAGHEVVGTTTSPAKTAALRAAGAEPVILDLLDRASVRSAVAAARPDAIVHEATALAGIGDLKHFDRVFAATNRLRTEGTDALLAAARDIGVRRFVAQSYTSWPYARVGGPVKTETDPLDPTPVADMRETFAAIVHLERVVLDYGGVALRYGGFYGSPDDPQIEVVRKRRFPVVGDGGGIWSFVHFEDAAAATVLALDRGTGVYNIVDDDPAPVREWLPAFAEAVGAKPPLHVPRWAAKIVAGSAVVVLTTEMRGASNAKAKKELGWTLRYPSWREGFPASYGKGRRPEMAGFESIERRITDMHPR